MVPRCYNLSCLRNIGLILAFFSTLVLSACSAYTAWYTKNTLQPYLDARYDNGQAAQGKAVFVFWIGTAAHFALLGLNILCSTLKSCCGLGLPHGEEDEPPGGQPVCTRTMEFISIAGHLIYAIFVLSTILYWKHTLVEGPTGQAWAEAFRLMIVLMVIDLATDGALIICILSLSGLFIYFSCRGRRRRDSEPLQFELGVSPYTTIGLRAQQSHVGVRHAASAAS